MMCLVQTPIGEEESEEKEDTNEKVRSNPMVAVGQQEDWQRVFGDDLELMALAATGGGLRIVPRGNLDEDLRQRDWFAMAYPMVLPGGEDAEELKDVQDVTATSDEGNVGMWSQRPLAATFRVSSSDEVLEAPGAA
ncbi:unnamed protein product, partial [Durusdinium trenchii]